MRADTSIPAAAILAAAVLAGCGSAGKSTPATAHAASAPTRTSVASATTTGTATIASSTTATRPPRHLARHRHPAPDPGSLPQTPQRPPATAPDFRARMGALWRGVVRDSPGVAARAFFPLGAYEQVKTLADPAADYAGRLVGDYRLDLAAAHALLGPDPASWRLLTVSVPEGDAHWIPSGVCDNRVGYWEVPNARLVYRRGGAVRSFGIASLISWRGSWYVVHLGAVARSGGGGLVDDPAVGPGISVPSSTC